MKILLFGATGMVGQGVLRECLRHPRVTDVLVVGRTPVGISDPRLREILDPDAFARADFSHRAEDFAGYDACLYCLGPSVTTWNEAVYRHGTVDVTLAVARVLKEREPNIDFAYISGAGVDGTRRWGPMWMRAKGEVETALERLAFRSPVLLRPALIRPLHGIRARSLSHRVAYALLAPLMPLLTRAFPGWVTDTERLGRAMLRAVSREPAELPRVLDTRAINALGAPRA